jgi:isoleucyl-tRNA synthetase
VADETRRQFLIPLWNVYSFFVTYANLDAWTPHAPPPAGEAPVLDRWIGARLGQVTQQVTAHLDAYEPHLAAAALQEFLDHLSNWYLRRSRRRFWSHRGAGPESDSDKALAYAALYQALTTLIRLLAPFVPFVTEVMYQNLVRAADSGAAESVHHTSWPSVTEPIDDALLDEMGLVMRLVSLGHAARNAAGRKLRQPLAEMAFTVRQPREAQAVVRFAGLIADELNVKSVRVLDAATEAVEFRLNPLPRQLGQKYGPRFPRIRLAVAALDPTPAALRLANGEDLLVEVDGERLTLHPDEVEVRMEARQGFAAASDGPYLAALRTELTQELVREGLAREVIRRIQELRRSLDLRLDQRLEIVYQASPELAKALEQFADFAAGEVLAVGFKPGAVSDPGAHEFTFEGESIRIRLTPVP